MNTKIYKRVHSLATDLLKATTKQNESLFAELYEQLNSLCIEHENTEKNHPVQWETLADFTEDSHAALKIYEKALVLAADIESHDFLASINYAMAIIHEDHGDHDDARNHIMRAAESSGKIQDSQLQDEIKTLQQALGGV